MQNLTCAVQLLDLIKSAKFYVCCAIIRSYKECKVQLFRSVKSAKFFVCFAVIKSCKEFKIVCVLCRY